MDIFFVNLCKSLCWDKSRYPQPHCESVYYFSEPVGARKNTSNEQNIGWHYLLKHRRKDVFWPLGFYTSYGLI